MTKKAIILTSAPLLEDEKKLLKATDIVKVALNHHAEELQPTVRFTSDYITKRLRQMFEQPVFSARANDSYSTMVFSDTLGSSIADSIKWLDSIGYTDILLVADNTVNGSNFQNLVYQTTKDSLYKANIYKYTEDGYFDCKYMSVEDFITYDER